MSVRADRSHDMPGDPGEQVFDDPAFEMLVALARGTLRPEHVSRARRAIERGIDWSAFHELVVRHRLLPIVNRHLSEHAALSSLVPPQSVRVLRSANDRVARRALWLTAELRQVVERLADQNIRVVPLKGPVLAQQLYGSVAMRSMGDLDVWVGEQDLERAIAALASFGYRPDQEGAAGEAYRRAFHHVGLIADGRPRLELHFHLHPRLGTTSYGAVLDARHHLEPIAFAGTAILTMRPAELLVFLSMHGVRHAWERLEWVCGLAELVRSATIDWQEVERRAHEMGATQAVRASLALAQRLLDAPVPVEHCRISRLATRANRTLLRRMAVTKGQPATARDRLAYLLLTDDRWSVRARRVWEEVTIPRGPDVVAVRIPRPLSGLYRLVRPARLITRAVTRRG